MKRTTKAEMARLVIDSGTRLATAVAERDAAKASSEQAMRLADQMRKERDERRSEADSLRNEKFAVYEEKWSDLKNIRSNEHDLLVKIRDLSLRVGLLRGALIAATSLAKANEVDPTPDYGQMGNGSY